MELNSIAEFLEHKSILVTGSTGFVAKILVEKVLRTQPNVKRLYLLLRAADAKLAEQRLHNEVLEKDVFKVLKEKYGPKSAFDSFISNKLVAVAGDISLENLGVEDTDLRDQLFKEVDIIINTAATTKFDERYDVALGNNTLGPKHVLDFAKDCSKLEMFLHVSTAYVCGETSGVVLEKPFKMGETLNGTLGLDIDEELNLMNQKLSELRALKATKEAEKAAMEELGLKRARLYGWPNTYVFTKAMGEMLVGEFREEIPLVIIRPTIIISTYKEPFPGWIQGFRTIDSLTAVYGKGKLTFFLGNPDSILDVIPGDMVVNAMIIAMVAHANHPSQNIYQLGSSFQNPLKLNTFRSYLYNYFTKNPRISKDGKQIKVGKGILFNSMAAFYAYITFCCVFPLKGLQVLNAALCQHLDGPCNDLSHKISLVLRFVELYKPYAFFQGIFNVANLEKLSMALDENEFEEKTFHCDPKCIDWEDYFMNIHFPGLVKHVF
ncbi:hypothetical protein Syun_016520 [Stephania yunnanensis]|uniref:Fatty acyl-CoA reductase n=1 Tax=Stephania yunnanensis TaxID=152371 RepID=A0AAP0J5E0_9MAGN